jgi:DNA-binding transcriptional ArsR family regulator
MTLMTAPDIFSMPTVDRAAMREIARKQIAAQMAMRAPSSQTAEAKLLAKMNPTPEPVAVEEKPKRVPKTDRTAVKRFTAAQTRDLILAALVQPKTAHDISRETGLPGSSLSRHLKDLTAEGLIVCAEQGRHAKGQLKPFIYALPGQLSKDAHKPTRKAGIKKPDRRAKVLALLSTPHAPFQIAKALGMERASACHYMRALAADGLIRKAGMIECRRTNGVMTWVRA